MLCDMISSMGEFHNEFDARSNVKALEFLLSVGANPNALPSGDDLAARISCAPFGPLQVAVSIQDYSLANRVVEVLIIHRADPSCHPEGARVYLSGALPGMRLFVQLMLDNYRDTPPTPRLCPCGSKRACEQCHMGNYLSKVSVNSTFVNEVCSVADCRDCVGVCWSLSVCLCVQRRICAECLYALKRSVCA